MALVLNEVNKDQCKFTIENVNVKIEQNDYNSTH